MIWVLVALFGFIAWLSVAGLFLALCHVAGQADEFDDSRERQPLLRDRRLASVGGMGVTGADVIDLRALRKRPRHPALSGR